MRLWAAELADSSPSHLSQCTTKLVVGPLLCLMCGSRVTSLVEDVLWHKESCVAGLH